MTTDSKTLVAQTMKTLVGKQPVAAPRGMDGLRAEDVTFPRYQLAQGSNSQLVKQGAKQGSFVNSLTGEEVESFEFIPLKLTKYTDLLRKENGKMVFDHRVFDETSPELEGRRFFNDRKKDLKADANRVYAWSGLVNGLPATIAFKKTSYDSGKALNAMIVFSKKDPWANKYRISAKKTTNASGEEYYIINVAPAGATTPEELATAEYYFSVIGGKPASDMVGDAQED